jgi:hypothetical protein
LFTEAVEHLSTDVAEGYTAEVLLVECMGLEDVWTKRRIIVQRKAVLGSQRSTIVVTVKRTFFKDETVHSIIRSAISSEGSEVQTAQLN